MSAMPRFKPGKSPPTHQQLYERALRGQPAHKVSYGKRPVACAFLAEGGPYNGRVLALVDGNTAIISIQRGKYGAKVRGRYRVGIVTSRPAHTVNVQQVEQYFKDHGRRDTLNNFSRLGTAVWEPL